MADGPQIALPCSTIVAGRPIPITIRLIALNQSCVYAGLLEGVPTTEMNRRLVELAVRDAKTTFADSDPFLVVPKQEPLDMERDYPFGKPATIPSVRCIARFLCQFPTPRGTPDDDYSSMTVIWFQEEFAMPIDGEVLDSIRGIDWLSLATNWQW